MRWDLFISHASEDKDEIVRPLANKFSDRNVRVWYDEFELRIGDSLRESIENGLRHSRYGLVVLSPHFFEKKWPKRELDGLFTLETSSRNRILPIWHNVTAEDVTQYSLLLADRVGLPTNKGLDVLADKITEKICIFRITDHYDREHEINISCCETEGVPVIPAWIEKEPHRIKSDWLIERIKKRAELRVFKDLDWEDGIWFVVDELEGDGVVINKSQFNDLIPPSSTTQSPTTTPPPTPYS